MFLEKITLKFYRNYQNQTINFKNGINILVGNNGVGKTNLLESIHFIALNKSHKTTDEKLLINQKSNFFKLNFLFKEENIHTKVEVCCDNEKKIFKVDENEVKNINNYIPKFKIIIFSPDDLELLKGSPDARRKYLNNQISQLCNNYSSILNDYNKLLKSRNEYIFKIKNNEPYNKIYFDILNDYYIKKSILIYKMRKKYIDKINEYLNIIFFEITKINFLFLEYNPVVHFTNYDSKNMYKEIQESINLSEEISYGKSIYGPHRDDFKFLLNDNDLRLYGSQGQQRSAVLSLKLSEINIFNRVVGENPLVLLDDVFSELDIIKRNNLLKYIKYKTQVIITTTDIKNIEKDILKKARVFEIINGKIKRRGKKDE